MNKIRQQDSQNPRLDYPCVVQFLLSTIQSDFVYSFLKGNVTNLQVALLAVNAATLGIVLTKIRELIDKTGKREEFNSVRKEMLLSIKEQVALIAVSLLILALATSKMPPFQISTEIYQTLLLTSFIYSLLILYDTAESVFVILDY